MIVKGVKLEMELCMKCVALCVQQAKMTWTFYNILTNWTELNWRVQNNTDISVSVLTNITDINRCTHATNQQIFIIGAYKKSLFSWREMHHPAVTGIWLWRREDDWMLRRLEHSSSPQVVVLGWGLFLHWPRSSSKYKFAWASYT